MTCELRRSSSTKSRLLVPRGPSNTPLDVEAVRIEVVEFGAQGEVRCRLVLDERVEQLRSSMVWISS